MNLDRVRERLNAAEDKTVYRRPLIIYEFPGEPPPHHANDMVRRPGESDDDVFKRYGVKVRRDRPFPFIRLRLNCTSAADLSRYE
jgi:hypothetical protein